MDFMYPENNNIRLAREIYQDYKIYQKKAKGATLKFSQTSVQFPDA